MIESSKYIFHYTRDVNPFGGERSEHQALDNLVNIVVDQEISTFNNHSMFPELLDEIYAKKYNEIYSYSKANSLSSCEKQQMMDRELLEKDRFMSLFNVGSFTEIPFIFHGELLRQCNYSPFGVAFNKKDVVVSGNYTCNSCFYVYEPNVDDDDISKNIFRDTIKERISFQYDEIIPKPLDPKTAILRNTSQENKRLLISLFSLVRGKSRVSNPRHDFAFEREWRNLGDFGFHIEQVQFIIIKEEFVDLFKKKVSEKISNIYPDGETDEGLQDTIFRKIIFYPIKAVAKLSYPDELLDHNLTQNLTSGS